MNLSVLDNAAGTGILSPILKREKAILEETKCLLAKSHTPKEYAVFLRQASIP